jgi:hypothetical protein
MKNGDNSWGVSFSRIAWLENAVRSHNNVAKVSRHDDIIIEVRRVSGRPIVIMCLDEYTLGEAAVRRVMQEFPSVNFISVGGNWNGYSPEAKELCISHKIGLFNSSELSGALFKDEFWTYHKKDENGNPVYPYKEP